MSSNSLSTDVEEFSCNNCDNTFKLRRALMMHMKNKHNQQGSNGSTEGLVTNQTGDSKEEGVKKIGQRHRCPHCGEAFRKLPTMLLHVREDHDDEPKVEENKTEDKEQKHENETEKMLCETENLEEEVLAKDEEVVESMETTVQEEEVPVEEEKVKEVEDLTKKEVNEKMSDDMDDILKMCKEIDGKTEKEPPLVEEKVPEKVEEELLGDLSQEEDEDDLSSQCKHCGVDMFIESELKKHVLLRYIQHSNHNSNWHFSQYLRIFYILSSQASRGGS